MPGDRSLVVREIPVLWPSRKRGDRHAHALESWLRSVAASFKSSFKKPSLNQE
jgi:hypothetical protein